MCQNHVGAEPRRGEQLPQVVEYVAETNANLYMAIYSWLPFAQMVPFLLKPSAYNLFLLSFESALLLC